MEETMQKLNTLNLMNELVINAHVILATDSESVIKRGHF